MALRDQLTVKGGIYDANGIATEYGPFSNGGEFFTHLDLCWSPTRAERYLKDIHVSAWHVDERENAGVPESHGIAFGTNWTFQERFMPFFRIGWAEGEAPFMHRAVTSGFMYSFPTRGDLTGFAMTWEDPPQKALREQNTIELFYRFQLSKGLAITPSIQVLLDPASNPNTDSITIFGLRARLAL